MASSGINHKSVLNLFEMTESTALKRTSTFTQFFTTTWDAFESACQTQQTQVVWLTVGGSTIKLSFAGQAMVANVLPALAHLVVAPQASVDLHIGVWDSASTAVSMTPPPWAEDDYAPRGEIKGMDGQTAVHVAYHPGSGILSLLDVENQTAVLWMRDARECPYYEQAAPLRTIFHWWASSKGQQFVHGAAIGTEDGAVLLSGKGGSGKSTTALNCLLSGMTYLGDDYVLCDLAGKQTAVYSVFNSAKVDAQALQLLPQLADKVTGNPQQTDEKRVLLAYEHFPHLLRQCLPLRAILIPQVTNEVNTQLHPVKQSLAFLALAPTTVFQLPGARETAVSFLRQLVMQLPCYQLQPGSDLAQIPPVIQAVLERHK